MKVYKNFTDLAREVNVKEYDLEIAYQKWINSSIMKIGNTKIIKHIKDNEQHFVIINKEDNLDCKEYIMEYKISDYSWRVYVDDVEGWQECKVIDVKNIGLDINEATVVCKSGTQLNRIVKYAYDEEGEDMVADGCIYGIE